MNSVHSPDLPIPTGHTVSVHFESQAACGLLHSP